MGEMYSEEELLELREAVKAHLSSKRYRHVLAVEGEAAFYAEIYLKNQISEVRAAALLHDIAKEISSENQLNYIKRFDIIERDPESIPESVLHAAAAPSVIKSEFPKFATENILSAVAWHTSGRPAMTVFDAIIMLADMTEPTRTTVTCRKIRSFYRGNLPLCESDEERYELLKKTVTMCLIQTVMYVKETGRPFYEMTGLAADYFSAGGDFSPAPETCEK